MVHSGEGSVSGQNYQPFAASQHLALHFQKGVKRDGKTRTAIIRENWTENSTGELTEVPAKRRQGELKLVLVLGQTSEPHDRVGNFCQLSDRLLFLFGWILRPGANIDSSRVELIKIVATESRLYSSVEAINVKPVSILSVHKLHFINPLRPNNDLSQTSHCNIKGVSVSEVIRIENMITQVKFYWYFNSFSSLLL